jgi:ribonuclease III
VSAKSLKDDAGIVVLEARIKHRFKNRALIREALTHGSALDGASKKRRSYQRLEFLGDRVLGLVIAEHLLKHHADEEEGELAPRFNALVNRHACARAARRADLGAAAFLSPSEAAQGGRDKDAILSDLCESVIAALFLDSGLDAARGFIARFWEEEFANGDAPRDAKTLLQEWAARKRRGLAYTMVEQSGPEHSPRFVVDAEVTGFAPARGQGNSKREAQRAAATAFLKARGVDV